MSFIPIANLERLSLYFRDFLDVHISAQLTAEPGSSFYGLAGQQHEEVTLRVSLFRSFLIFASKRNEAKHILFRFIFACFCETKKKIFRFISHRFASIFFRYFASNFSLQNKKKHFSFFASTFSLQNSSASIYATQWIVNASYNQRQRFIHQE
jgi:hypothetical protein